MKTSLICLSFLLCLTCMTLTTEEEVERQINLGQLGPDLLSLLTAALAGAGTAGLVSALSGGGEGKGKAGIFGKHGLFGKDGIFGKGKGKGKKRSLLTAAERQPLDLSTLLALLGGNEGLSSLLLGGDGGISNLIQMAGGNGGLAGLIGNSGTDAPVGKGKAGKGKDGKGVKGKDGKGKDGKGKNGKGKDEKGKGTDSLGSSLLDTFSSTQEISITDIFGRKLVSRGILDTLSGLTGVATDGKGGKGKDGKGKGKDGKGKDGKGKDGKGKGKEGKGKGKDSTDTLYSAFSNFRIFGQIIQAVLNLLMGAGRSLNPIKTVLDTKTTVAPLPNPLTDPMGFIQNPLISAIIQAIVSGDISAMMKAQGDLAGTLITQFVINAIS